MRYFGRNQTKKKGTKNLTENDVKDEWDKKSAAKGMKQLNMYRDTEWRRLQKKKKKEKQFTLHDYHIADLIYCGTNKKKKKVEKEKHY